MHNSRNLSEDAPIFKIDSMIPPNVGQYVVTAMLAALNPNIAFPPTRNQAKNFAEPVLECIHDSLFALSAKPAQNLDLATIQSETLYPYDMYMMIVATGLQHNFFSNPNFRTPFYPFTTARIAEYLQKTQPYSTERQTNIGEIITRKLPLAMGKIRFLMIGSWYRDYSRVYPIKSLTLEVSVVSIENSL